MVTLLILCKSRYVSPSPRAGTVGRVVDHAGTYRRGQRRCRTAVVRRAGIPSLIAVPLLSFTLVVGTIINRRTTVVRHTHTTIAAVPLSSVALQCSRPRSRRITGGRKTCEATYYIPTGSLILA